MSQIDKKKKKMLLIFDVIIVNFLYIYLYICSLQTCYYYQISIGFVVYLDSN